MAKLQRETTKARRRKVQCCWKANFCLRIFQFPRFIIRVRLFNVGLQFLAAKVAFSCPSADRFGKKNLGLITWGQIKSVPNFCWFGLQRAEKCNFWMKKTLTLFTPRFPALLVKDMKYEVQAWGNCCREISRHHWLTTQVEALKGEVSELSEQQASDHKALGGDIDKLKNGLNDKIDGNLAEVCVCVCVYRVNIDSFTSHAHVTHQVDD